MKIRMLFVFMMCCIFLQGQWTPVNTGLDGHTPTSMYGWYNESAVWIGTLGGGVFKTLDEGENWENINGDLPNLNVNNIQPFGTGTSMFVATEGGPFFTMNESEYTNCTDAGLSNTDINYFGFGGDDPADYVIGTNGDGVFAGPDWSGPWTAKNNGLPGNAMIINDLGGYSDDDGDYSVMVCDNGVYFSDSVFTAWTAKNNGLTGNSLIVKKLTGLGSAVFIATHGGLYFSMDLGDTWTPLIADEIFNTVGIVQTDLAPYGLAVFAFGTNGYYSLDFTTYHPIDISGIEGDITCFAITPSNLFIGVASYGKSGSVYRHPLAPILAVEDDKPIVNWSFQLNQNYPNPFNPSTKISFILRQPQVVKLEVINVMGQSVKILFEGRLPSGNHEYYWQSENNNGQLLSSGIYFYRLSNGSYSQIRKMVLVR